MKISKIGLATLSLLAAANAFASNSIDCKIFSFNRVQASDEQADHPLPLVLQGRIEQQKTISLAANSSDEMSYSLLGYKDVVATFANLSNASGTGLQVSLKIRRDDQNFIARGIFDSSSRHIELSVSRPVGDDFETAAPDNIAKLTCTRN